MSAARTQSQNLPALQPYQADTDDLVRGRQSGYNRCNSTTEGAESLCQTAVINHLDGKFSSPFRADMIEFNCGP